MKIATRIRLMACGLVIATALSVGLVECWSYRSLVTSQQQENLERQVETEALRLESALADLKNDVSLLAGLPAIHAYIEAHGRGDRIDEEMWNDSAAAVFAQMLRTHPHYVKAAFIGVEDGGREIVRVNGGANGPDRVPEPKLKRKGASTYFADAIALPLGKVYVGPITLSREDGVISAASRPAACCPAHPHSRRRKLRHRHHQRRFPDVPRGAVSVTGRPLHYYLTTATATICSTGSESHSASTWARAIACRTDFRSSRVISTPTASLSPCPVLPGSRVRPLISFRGIFPDGASACARHCCSYDDVTDQALQVGWGHWP
jgi:hypothetical protein